MPRRFSDASFARTALDGSTPAASRGEPGPFEIYVPRGYEPNYAYPLLIWFHDAGQNERVLHDIMSQVTDRNAVGLALRGERVRRSGGFDWLGGDRPRRHTRLLAALRELRRDFHIHTERIILAGQGSGAVPAIREIWNHPECYGGLALFDASWRSFPIELHQRDALLGKPALLDNRLGEIGHGREVASQLRAMGMDVTLQHNRQCDIHRQTCRTLDRWVLGAVCGVPV